MGIDKLLDKFDDVKTLVSEQIGKKEMLEKEKYEINNKIKETDILENVYCESSEVLQQTSNIMKTKTIEKIEILATKGISDVLNEDNLKFVIKYDAKRNAISADYEIYDKITEEYYDIINSFGGGMIDIISIVIKIIFLYKFNVSKILILDEAGKWISNDKQQNFGRFLKIMSKELDIQIILISHKEQVIEEADRVFRVKKINDESKVEVIR